MAGRRPISLQCVDKLLLLAAYSFSGSISGHNKPTGNGGRIDTVIGDFIIVRFMINHNLVNHADGKAILNIVLNIVPDGGPAVNDWFEVILCEEFI